MGANEVDLFVRKLLDRYVGAEARMLDVGCGPAPYKEWVAGKYIGLDITDEPYGPGMPSRADLVASAMNLPLLDDSIDVVFSKSAFFLVPDPDAALSEFRRVLRDGGCLLLLDYNRRTQSQMQASEGIARPRWTQWGLKSRVQAAGFKSCELQVPTAKEVGPLERSLRLVHQELLGTWAIVSAVK
jgi:ubiquinone/menaquinone biosynthesis C-methylase UbiE